MHYILPTITQAFLFISLYIQVFLIITLVEHRDAMKKRPAVKSMRPEDMPTVSVIVPCFNEEATVIGTIQSLKQLNYPQEKLSIIAVDDGSTDDTWSYLLKYQNDPQISIYRKENGGKHTAVNLGIAKSTSDIIGCLDADSFVHPEALNRMLPSFMDPAVMAVTPAIQIRSPKKLLEYIQYAEYNIGIFLRKMYSTLNAIHVTPGPFSMFRRSLFSVIGPFKSAHNTEDLEIALRIHRHNFKIENCQHAFVYTTPPQTIRALVKQRVRWTTGFLLNISDYRDLLFSRKHGQIGTFTLPAGIISLASVLFFAFFSVVNAANSMTNSIKRYQLIGFQWHWPSFQWFYVNTTASHFMTLILLLSAVCFIFLGKRITSGTWKVSRDMLCYAFLYAFIAPVWVAISSVRAVTRNTGSWR
ncbi:MAG: Biofilm synthesis N-glycosyltransferase PgaC [Candidatus Parcubacteria bacterium]|nr:Biofilm synthesis N-glycosyltransferase PgaC [Candidatus Parcubacteria bacterium]